MHLADIPVEVFLDNLLPFAQVCDILNLGSTNKFFAALSADETFWKRRCQQDFNFTSQETARQSGWKNLYRGLRYPRIFVWGFVIFLIVSLMWPSRVVTQCPLQSALKW
jgi:SCF-associated factor 1